ncbi:hypothetical protein PRA02_004695 [Salmonella enterica]|nr:hypothetical protein [Salmonella enterica]EKL3440992.1 hypothetical protein [Salmonella enterica]
MFISVSVLVVVAVVVISAFYSVYKQQAKQIAALKAQVKEAADLAVKTVCAVDNIQPLNPDQDFIRLVNITNKLESFLDGAAA